MHSVPQEGKGGREQQMLGKGWSAGIVIRDLVSTLSTTREGRREGGGGRKGERTCVKKEILTPVH